MEQLGGELILGPLVRAGEELYQSWDGRGDEIRDSWDHLFLDASWWRYQSAEGRGEPMTPPPPLQLLSETFLVGFRAGLAGTNWTRATHSCEAVCSLSAYLCLTLTEARGGGQACGCPEPGQVGFGEGGGWYEFTCCSSFSFFYLLITTECVCVTKNGAVNSRSDLLRWFRLCRFLPANFCSCWLCGADGSSCSSHLTSCHSTETQDI